MRKVLLCLAAVSLLLPVPARPGEELDSLLLQLQLASPFVKFRIIEEIGDLGTPEAMDALVSLGYKPAEVKRLLGQLDLDDKSAEDIIRLALKQAAQ